MRFRPTPLPGAVLVEQQRHEDDRGFFARTYCDDEFAAAGLPTTWPQHNVSHNARAGTLRGMHYNAAPHQEAKLVRCVTGAVWDAIVDLRPGSPTHLQWFGVELSSEAGNALYVPEGFAHGFITLQDRTDVFYLMGKKYQGSVARGFRWDDPRVGIVWPAAPVVIAERDRTYPDLDPANPDALR
ncbi:MAG TPA: dTDP-4-dehydrorhamnose 3,5-epimerase [Polyangia bacterium]|nr:dTDP-4-dehydrorhamnose 3,5-epimerase [Polyangia bacterium]